jgi:hypothetical protein
MLNPYFTQGRRSEQDLYEDIVIESLKVYGQNVYYLPRTIVNQDSIFKDDIPSTYGSAYRLEMYIENVEGFDGDGDLFSKFGVEIRDQATFVCARRRFATQIGNRQEYSSGTQYYRPKEGDLIYLPLSGSIFQISKVEDESPFYQLQNLPVFRMQCDLFEYNDEDLDTNIEAIDALESKFAYKYILTLDSDGNVGASALPFQKGETVIQTLSDGTQISGEVSESFTDSDLKLHLIHVGADDGKFHLPTTGLNVVGVTSTAVASVTAVSEEQQIMPSTQADEFDAFEDGFIDFSEGNPFGDPE